jgi:long-chain acyl-CoA synthetase
MIAMPQPSKRAQWETVPEIVQSCASHRPDVIVLAGAGTAGITAAELLELVRRGARRLVDSGVRRGDFVAVDTTTLSWAQTAIAYFATTWLGAAAILLMGQATAAAADGIDDQALLIAGPQCPAGRRCQLTITELTSSSLLAGPPDARPADLLDIVFTSGTTGTPKAVSSTHQQWTNLVRPEMMSSRARRVVVHNGIPVAVSGGLHGVLLSHLARGVTSVYAETAAEVAAAGDGYDVDELHLTPHSARALSQLAAASPAGGARVRIIRVIGGPLAREVADRLTAKFPHARLVSMYGLTEAGAALMIKLVDGSADDSIGQPVSGTQVRVVDGDGQEVPAGTVGELAVRTEGIDPLAYYAEEGLTRSQFSGGWTKTGDLGYIDAGGNVRMVGREREMVVLRGGRVKPETIEEILARQVAPGVEFVVVGLASAGSWDRIAVFLAGDPADPEIAETLQRLRGLKGPFRPQVVEVVPQIPRAPFGKPLRRVLAQRLAVEG